MTTTDDAHAEAERRYRTHHPSLNAAFVAGAEWAAARAETTTATTEETARLRIEGTWLVSEVDHHTCGTDRDGHYGAHEPDCGLVPEVDLSTLPGWAGLLATARTSPTHAQAMEAIALHLGWQPGLIEAADAVMELYSQQPTEAEAGARALEQVCDDLRNLSVGQVIRDGSSWIKLGDLLNRLTEHEDRAARLRAGERP